MNTHPLIPLVIILLVGGLITYAFCGNHSQDKTENIQQFINTCTENTQGQINMSVSLNETTGRTITWTFEDINPESIISQ